MDGRVFTFVNEIHESNLFHLPESERKLSTENILAGHLCYFSVSLSDFTARVISNITKY